VQEMYRANTQGFNGWAGPAELQVMVELKTSGKYLFSIIGILVMSIVLVTNSTDP